MFKEEIKFLESLESKQVRIWEDSCDLGVFATPEIKKEMRRVIATLLPLEGSKLTSKIDFTMLVIRNYLLRVYWSVGEGTQVEVGYYKSENKEFFTFYSSPFRD